MVAESKWNRFIQFRGKGNIQGVRARPGKTMHASVKIINKKKYFARNFSCKSQKNGLCNKIYQI
jgi:hypothetical protein